MLRRIVSALAGVLIAGLIAGPAFAEPVNTTFFGTALKGYDTVAYHAVGRTVEGSRRFSHTWRGATWRFASAENRDLFAADPERYAPAYGGYCAYGMTQGAKVDIDPTAWRIVDGRLYLNANRDVQRIWVQDIPGYIARADTHWQRITG